mgnify:CR=1 FL=1
MARSCWRSTPAPTATRVTADDAKAFISQYCLACHSERAKTAGMDSARKLTLDALDPANVAKDAKTWEFVVRKVGAGMMPPVGAKRPEPAQINALVDKVGRRIAAAAGHGMVFAGGVLLGLLLWQVSGAVTGDGLFPLARVVKLVDLDGLVTAIRDLLG